VAEIARLVGLPDDSDLSLAVRGRVALTISRYSQCVVSSALCDLLRPQSDLESLDLGPLPGFPLRDLDIGGRFHALDLGVGRGRLPGGLDLRLCGGDGRIG
jgi:hypothetical protein